eukprot:gene4983-5641_t
MDTKEQLPHDNIIGLNKEDRHISCSEEPMKTNGTSSVDHEKKERNRRASRGDSEHRPSALAVFNRRLRLLFRPWKWRRKARNRQRSISESPKVKEEETIKHLDNEHVDHSSQDVTKSDDDMPSVKELQIVPYKPSFAAMATDHQDTEHAESDGQPIAQPSQLDNHENGHVPLKEDLLHRVNDSSQIQQYPQPSTSEGETLPTLISCGDHMSTPESKNSEIITKNDESYFRDNGEDPPKPIEKGPNFIATDLKENEDGRMEEENPPPIPPRTSSIVKSKNGQHNPALSGRGSFYDNYPPPVVDNKEDNGEKDMSFYSSSSDESEYEEENDNNIVTGLASKVRRSDSLAMKLKERPSRDELIDKHIIEVKSQDEIQEQRHKVENKLVRRLSQRPSKEELEQRNILKCLWLHNYIWVRITVKHMPVFLLHVVVRTIVPAMPREVYSNTMGLLNMLSYTAPTCWPV